MFAAGTAHESLPYIDTEPTETERVSALALIAKEVETDRPSIRLPVCRFSPRIQAEIFRIERKVSLDAIDLSRYESLEPPASNDANDVFTQIWRGVLVQTYTSHEYLDGRLKGLALLEKFGKNAWLVGNSQLEDILRCLDKQLRETKTAIDIVVGERKAAQEAISPEIEGLEEGWKRSIGRLLETEIAAEALRRRILDARWRTSG